MFYGFLGIFEKKMWGGGDFQGFSGMKILEKKKHLKKTKLAIFENPQKIKFDVFFFENPKNKKNIT